MKRYTLLVALSVMLWGTEAMANTIGFDTLGGSNQSTFTSYVEEGYTVSAVYGSWHVAQVFGSAFPSIFAGPIGSPGPSQIEVTDGGEQFSFGGVDLTSNSASGTSYLIQGFLGAVNVFSLPETILSINTFESRLFSGLGNVDRLTITGTPVSGVTSFNIDNIRAGAAVVCDSNGCSGSNIPEPASLMLLGVGLAGIGIWRRQSTS
ncbi:MAG: hypothetical protein JW384_02878 [Nitrosomonadaceae bacterium]|nr:hypothetical protein [Nitrosomonadaceae bacterium]